MPCRPKQLPRDAPLNELARAPLSALREGHRIRLGLADGRLGLWQHAPPPPAPLFADAAYRRAYQFAVSGWSLSPPDGRGNARGHS